MEWDLGAGGRGRVGHTQLWSQTIFMMYADFRSNCVGITPSDTKPGTTTKLLGFPPDDVTPT